MGFVSQYAKQTGRRHRGATHTPRFTIPTARTLATGSLSNQTSLPYKEFERSD
jgi:hypothetical protein